MRSRVKPASIAVTAAVVAITRSSTFGRTLITWLHHQLFKRPHPDHEEDMLSASSSLRPAISLPPLAATGFPIKTICDSPLPLCVRYQRLPFIVYRHDPPFDIKVVSSSQRTGTPRRPQTPHRSGSPKTCPCPTDGATTLARHRACAARSRMATASSAPMWTCWPCASSILSTAHCTYML